MVCPQPLRALRIIIILLLASIRARTGSAPRESNPTALRPLGSRATSRLSNNTRLQRSAGSNRLASSARSHNRADLAGGSSRPRAGVRTTTTTTSGTTAGKLGRARNGVSAARAHGVNVDEETRVSGLVDTRDRVSRG